MDLKGGAGARRAFRSWARPAAGIAVIATLALGTGPASAIEDSAGASGVRPRTESRRYVGGSPYTYLTPCHDDTPSGTGVGAACFRHRSDGFARFTIEDATGLPIGAEVWFSRGPRRKIVYGPRFCGTSGRIRIPGGSTEIKVFLAGPAELLWFCPTGAPATRGVVHGTFTSARPKRGAASSR